MWKAQPGRWVKPSAPDLIVDRLTRRVCGGYQETKGALELGWTITTPAFALLQPTWLLDTPTLKNATLTLGQLRKDYTFSREKPLRATSTFPNERRASRSRKLRSNIIWLADTNYRIDLSNENVRSLVAENDYDPLVGSDQVGLSPLSNIPKRTHIQLRLAIESGEAFSGYDEGPLLFAPTYKYDVGTDNYDSSEKMRIPAWTGTYPGPPSSLLRLTRVSDRILFQGNLDLSVYSRAELRGSDHRPGNVPRVFLAAEP